MTYQVAIRLGTSFPIRLEETTQYEKKVPKAGYRVRNTVRGSTRRPSYATVTSAERNFYEIKCKSPLTFFVTLVIRHRKSGTLEMNIFPVNRVKLTKRG